MPNRTWMRGTLADTGDDVSLLSVVFFAYCMISVGTAMCSFPLFLRARSLFLSVKRTKRVVVSLTAGYVTVTA